MATDAELQNLGGGQGGGSFEDLFSAVGTQAFRVQQLEAMTLISSPELFAAELRSRSSNPDLFDLGINLAGVNDVISSQNFSTLRQYIDAGKLMVPDEKTGMYRPARQYEIEKYLRGELSYQDKIKNLAANIDDGAFLAFSYGVLEGAVLEPAIGTLDFVGMVLGRGEIGTNLFQEWEQAMEPTINAHPFSRFMGFSAGVMAGIGLIETKILNVAASGRLMTRTGRLVADLADVTSEATPVAKLLRPLIGGATKGRRIFKAGLLTAAIDTVAFRGSLTQRAFGGALALGLGGGLTYLASRSSVKAGEELLTHIVGSRMSKLNESDAAVMKSILERWAPVKKAIKYVAPGNDELANLAKEFDGYISAGVKSRNLDVRQTAELIGRILSHADDGSPVVRSSVVGDAVTETEKLIEILESMASESSLDDPIHHLLGNMYVVRGLLSTGNVRATTFDSVVKKLVYEAYDVASRRMGVGTIPRIGLFERDLSDTVIRDLIDDAEAAIVGSDKFSTKGKLNAAGAKLMAKLNGEVRQAAARGDHAPLMGLLHELDEALLPEQTLAKLKPDALTGDAFEVDAVRNVVDPFYLWLKKAESYASNYSNDLASRMERLRATLKLKMLAAEELGSTRALAELFDEVEKLKAGVPEKLSLFGIEFTREELLAVQSHLHDYFLFSPFYVYNNGFVASVLSNISRSAREALETGSLSRMKEIRDVVEHIGVKVGNSDDIRELHDMIIGAVTPAGDHVIVKEQIRQEAKAAAKRLADIMEIEKSAAAESAKAAAAASAKEGVVVDYQGRKLNKSMAKIVQQLRDEGVDENTINAITDAYWKIYADVKKSKSVIHAANEAVATVRRIAKAVIEKIRGNKTPAAGAVEKEAKTAKTAQETVEAGSPSTAAEASSKPNKKRPPQRTSSKKKKTKE